MNEKRFDIMGWNECEKEFIRKVEIDKERADSLIKKSLLRLERARKTELQLLNYLK